MKVTLSYTQLTSNIGAPYILSVCIMFTASCTGIRNFTMPHTKPYFPAGLQSYTSLFCSIQFTWAWIWYDSNKPPSAWLKLCHSLYHPTLLHSPHLLFNYSQHRERAQCEKEESHHRPLMSWATQVTASYCITWPQLVGQYIWRFVTNQYIYKEEMQIGAGGQNRFMPVGCSVFSQHLKFWSRSTARLLHPTKCTPGFPRTLLLLARNSIQRLFEGNTSVISTAGLQCRCCSSYRSLRGITRPPVRIVQHVAPNPVKHYWM